MYISPAMKDGVPQQDWYEVEYSSQFLNYINE